MIATILLGAAWVLLLYASYVDVARLQISNALVIGLAILFLPFAAAAHIPFLTVLMHLAAGLTMLTLGFVLYTLGMRFGGGDAKLFAALSLWCGFAALPAFSIMMCLFGGALALILLALRWSGLAMALTTRGYHVPALDMDVRTPLVPYAPAMALSFISVSALGIAWP